MPEPFEELYEVRKEDVSRAATTYVDAFQHDPIWHAVFADYMNEKRRVHAAYETPVKYCLKYGSVYSNSKKLEGVAAWVPGEYSNMTLWRVIRCGAARSGMKIGFKVAKQMMTIFKPIERDRKENMNGKEYVYLFVLGVAQEYQGQGIGGKLLRALITESARNGKALYLETETQKNVAMYERFGFKLIKKIVLPIIDLPMWEMALEIDT